MPPTLISTLTFLTMHTRLLFTLTFGLLALTSFGKEPPVSSAQPIASIVSSALTNNPEIAFYQAQLALAKGERIDAGKQSNPQLSAQLGALVG